MRSVLLGIFAATSLYAHDLSGLPALPRPQAPVVAATTEPQWLGPGVGIIRDQAVVLTGRRWVDSGPDEGLAIMAALTSGRLHETLIRLDSDDALLLKSAFLLAFGWKDGDCNDALHGLPPRGVPVRMEWEWHDENGVIRRIDVSCLVRDRSTDQALPPLPFIYTGSRIGTQRTRNHDGSESLVPSFKLAEHRSLAALFDEHDALLSTPLPFLDNDLVLEVNTGLAPAGRTTGRLIITPAQLLLNLWADEAGDLRSGPDANALDDAALATLLTRHYGSNESSSEIPHDAQKLRAVGIHPPPQRASDPAISQRVMRTAIASRVWVLPVFLR
jgi:hypothetical protein